MLEMVKTFEIKYVGREDKIKENLFLNEKSPNQEVDKSECAFLYKNNTDNLVNILQLPKGETYQTYFVEGKEDMDFLRICETLVKLETYETMTESNGNITITYTTDKDLTEEEENRIKEELKIKLEKERTNK